MPVQKKAAAKKPAPSTKPLWQKLLVKDGTVALIAAPAGYDKLFDGSPAKVTTRGSDAAETVLVFASDEGQLRKALPSVRARVAPGGNLWVAYRKGGKELHRDTLAELMKSNGYQPVALVAVDETWSALRVKPL
jgi:hypothetical protein